MVTESIIMLNDEKIYMDRLDPNDFHMANRNTNGDNKTSKVYLQNWNSLIKEISETIDDCGLQEHSFENFINVNGIVERYSLSLIELKSHLCDQFLPQPTLYLFHKYNKGSD